MSRYRFFIALALYFATLTVIKLFGSLEYDDAEQALISTVLRPGYDNAQPPLYNYLQYLFFNIFGYGKFAIFLLKHLILFGIYISIYLFALDLTKSYQKAITAAILTLFLPQVVWQSELMLNHSVLAALLGVLFLWQVYRTDKEPSFKNFALIGLIGALGFLAKYSFALLFLTFLVYALVKRYKISYIFLSIALFLLISSPHLLWLAENINSVKAATLHKTSHGKGALSALFSLVKSTLAFLGPLIVALLFLKADLKKIDRNFLLFYAILFSILTLLALFGIVDSYKERWMLPFLTPIPALLAPAVNYSRRLELAGYGVLILMVVFYLLKIFYPDIAKPTNSNLPIKELSQALPEGMVAGDNVVLRGNFALYRNGTRKLYLSKEPKPGYKKICRPYLHSKKEFCIYYKEEI